MTPSEFRQTVHYRAGEQCQAATLLPAIDCWGGLEVHHLKNRSQCTAAEKVDPDNGRLLCSHHHAYVTEHPEHAHQLGLTVWGWE